MVMHVHHEHQSCTKFISHNRDRGVGSPICQRLPAHSQFHPSTTLLLSRDFAYQALFFLTLYLYSFFISPYFILLNKCDIEQKKERLGTSMVQL